MVRFLGLFRIYASAVEGALFGCHRCSDTNAFITDYWFRIIDTISMANQRRSTIFILIFFPGYILFSGYYFLDLFSGYTMHFT
uniref:Tetraspanin n=1 Tax=Parascaris univalens TaxID=6257 RepID=A0A915AL26_PARUN